MTPEIETDRELDGRWIAEVPSLPGVMAYGATPAAAEAEVVGMATLRAAELLDMDPAALAATLGLYGAGAARLLDGRLSLAPGGDPFDRAALFLRLFTALDQLVDGDQASARSWLRAFNVALRGEPLVLMQAGQGLAGVVQYLEANLARA